MVAAFENLRVQAEADQQEMLKGKQWKQCFEEISLIQNVRTCNMD